MNTPRPTVASTDFDWETANQAFLDVALQELRLRLQRRVLWLRRQWHPDPLKGHPEVISDQLVDWLLKGENWQAEQHFYAEDTQAAALGQAIDAANIRLVTLAASMTYAQRPAALPVLAHLCGLSPFEQQVVLLCFAPQVDPGFAELYAYVQDHAARKFATARLAVTLFAEDEQARHTALDSFMPESPLRRLAILDVEPGPFPATALASRPLHLASRIADYLRGRNRLDSQVADLLQSVPDAPLTSSQQDLAERLVRLLKDRRTLAGTLNLVGEAGIGKQNVAREVCARLGLQLARIDPDRLHAGATEQHQLLRCLHREAVLSPLAFYIDLSDPEVTDKNTQTALKALIEHLPALLMVGSQAPWKTNRQLSVVAVPPPGLADQTLLWQHALAGTDHTLDDRIEAIVQQFQFGPQDVVRAVKTAQHLAQMRNGGGKTEVTAKDLWQACRDRNSPRLDQLGRRILSGYIWDDIVLSSDLSAQLRELSAQVTQRHRVYEEWGFGSHLSRGRGISALFAGPSGTGKTMAAEVLANALQLDLYRIDLSGVVSKYIGETEKNLKQVFDAAEQSGVILFFDEADALFGKRTEVKDSHDRYANIEVNYLLQRMEDYRGLAILATNRKSALDRAFLRRLRFLMDFPFPDADNRRRIWEKVFPAATPLDSLDYGALARLEIPGGNIRNIALNAAFLAAAENRPVSMHHLAKAARREYIKIEKMITTAEFGAYYNQSVAAKPASMP
jgi:DNA polymerase III delta prime subunit